MAGNFLGKVAADTLGLSDIGKIISKEDFDKVDGDDYIMHEDGEKIFFVIKSKADEYVFTNQGVLHVDGNNAVSKKRTVVRHDFAYERVYNVTLETAGTIDLDVEIKFTIGESVFSIDVNRKQIEQLKDLYKSLIEISRLQRKNYNSLQDGTDGLKMANDSISKCHIDGGNVATIVKDITNFNLDWMDSLRLTYNNKDFSDVYKKYINN